MSPPKIYSKWPSAPLTDYLVRRAVAKIYSEPCYVSIPTADDDQGLLQWSSYDELDLQLTHSNAVNVLSSSYIIRKILIRKHFLCTSYIVQPSYLIVLNQHPESSGISRKIQLPSSTLQFLERMNSISLSQTNWTSCLLMSCMIWLVNSMKSTPGGY